MYHLHHYLSHSSLLQEHARTVHGPDYDALGARSRLLQHSSVLQPKLLRTDLKQVSYGSSTTVPVDREYGPPHPLHYAEGQLHWRGS